MSSGRTPRVSGVVEVLHWGPSIQTASDKEELRPEQTLETSLGSAERFAQVQGFLKSSKRQGAAGECITWTVFKAYLKCKFNSVPQSK